MGRSPCCDENGLKKGPWTPEEDEKLLQHIQKNGHGSWRTLPKLAGLNRCGKSCRLRWTNYLRPDIKRGKFSPEEEQTILHLHSVLGNKWSAIATHLPGRTDNEIKNFWNTHLKKRLIQMGFDPMTHRPRTDFFAALPQLLALANLRGLVNAASASTAQPLAEAAQAAKLQCLLQSAATIASISNTADTTLNTMSTPDVTSMYTTSTVQQMPYTLPEAPMAMSYGTELGCQGESSSSTAARAPVLPDSSLPPLAYLSGASDLADGFSASSCGGSWPEFFLDDAFATDFV